MSLPAGLLTARGDTLLLAVAARPGASRSAVAGLVGDALKVAVAAPPEKGKANKELLAYLAKALGLKKAQLSLHTGQTSRQKVVAITGVDAAALRSALTALLP